MQQLSPKQKEVLETILHFFINDKQRGGFVFSGVAGSGKTTIISILVKILSDLKYNVTSLAFTGKAVSALVNKGIQPASTLHSFLYVPVYEWDENDWDGIDDGGIAPGLVRKFVRFDKKHKDSFEGIDLVIIDESSFVPKQIFLDLMELEIPILFVGDREQLPPIDDTGFNIMDAPDIHLDEIHRQAEGNPIIMLSKIVRETGHFNTKYIDNNVVRLVNRIDINRSYLSQNPSDIILCGTNKNRMTMNKLCRAARGYHEEYAENNEIIINLRNSTAYGMNLNPCSIYNGELFRVLSSFPKQDKNFNYRTYGIAPITDKKFNNDSMSVSISDNAWFEESEKYSTASDGSILSEFTYGYAITVHKSQGSEFNNVLYLDDDVSFFTDQRKFRYTAITRARNTLTIAK